MTATEQSSAFYAEISKVVDRFATEFEIPFTCIIGCLHLKAHELMSQSLSVEDEQ